MEPSSTENQISRLDRTPTFYEILNISTTATRSEIRESYVRLRNAYSTHNQALYSLISDQDAQIQTGIIEEAFRTLNDDIKRRQYDIQIGIATKKEEPTFQPQTHYSRNLQNDDGDKYRNAIDRAFSGGAEPNQKPPVAQSLDKEFIKEINETNKNYIESMPAIGTIDARLARATKGRSEEVKQNIENILSSSDLSDGATLIKLREACNVSENEMQERTKICIEYLRGMEGNVYDRLPRQVFIKGFLRSYCKYLSVENAEPLVKAYTERYENWLKSKTS